MTRQRKRVVTAAAAALVCATAGGAASAGRGDGYEVSFRSRDSTWFGHNYVIVRKLSGGRVVSSRLVGFGPAPEASDLDALVGTAGWVGAEPDDKRAAATEELTLRIGRERYERVLRTIAAYKRDTPRFQLLGVNCNTFVGAVGRAAGVDVPTNEAVPPEDYIAEMRELNGAQPARSSRHARTEAMHLGAGVNRRENRDRPEPRVAKSLRPTDAYDWDGAMR